MQVMDENYDEEREENLDTQMPKNSVKVPDIEIEDDLSMCSSDTKPRHMAEEDPSMCSSDFEPSIVVYFDQDTVVEPIEDEEEGSYDEEHEENLDTQMPKNGTDSEIVLNIEIEEDPSMCSSDTKPRLVVEEHLSMCSSDEELSIEVYFDEDAEVEPIEDEEEGSPRHNDSNLIEPILEDEPSVVYLRTVTNHETRSPLSDETIHNRNMSMCTTDTKPRLVADEDPSMCFSDEEPSIEVYFDEDVEVEPIEDEEEGSPRHDDSNLIEPILEDEPCIVYLGTVTNHEKWSPTSDETIQNHKRGKLMSSPDADSDEGEFWFCSSMLQFPVNAIPSKPCASSLCVAF
ncbi:uncharacterized protein LOC131320855 [Rhododendron vialii]|uniref:uncharacterized protein LOC131320855 n=1 Tax=Rhododendron vialii TaxID=182163 RepID=UPI00265D7A34|nr:uncharacterized protein LOC131320855 [Rhododendron vialii]XP_058207731.1 uncharacterized protein LOC131320855 [Rhododendron vialii]